MKPIEPCLIPSPISWPSRPRRLVGLMSGTSLDGIDAVLIEVEGGIPVTALRSCAFISRPFTPEERARITGLLRPDVPLPELLHAHVWLGELFAAAALAVIAHAGLTTAQVDAIASHGQTIWHIPPADGRLGATLQIGEPSVIAERTGILTVADFRPRDMAAGGHGAPLVPFADYHLFRGEQYSRVVQNIGGIANLTWLPRGGTADDVIAFDTGPGNMVIDALVMHYMGRTYDQDGRLAAAGRVDNTLLEQLLQHPYFHQLPPKSTGREDFGTPYADRLLRLIEQRGLSPEDAIATATALTAETIARAYRAYLPAPVDEVILGGGGSYNRTMRAMLAARLPAVKISTHEDYGISSEAKEAIAFALLGHATLCGVPGNIPAATGAAHPVILGKITPGAPMAQ